MAEEGGELRGALFLRFTPRSVRVHSIAVHPRAQGQGIGARLLEQAAARACATGRRRVTLEASAEQAQLVDWYVRHGYERREFLPDYYAPGHAAWRLHRRLEAS